MSSELQLKELQQLLDHYEPLLPELEQCLEEVSGLGTVLRHPLVFSVPYFPVFNTHLNASYRAKLEAVAKFQKEEPEKAIWYYERPYRFTYFTLIENLFDDPTYWETLGSLFVDSENLHQVPNLRSILTANRTSREKIMDEEELEGFMSLPESFVIYRGYAKGRGTKMGWSWSLSPWKASWFARRFAVDFSIPTVVRGKVSKDQVIALLLRRNESEIVVDPKNVKLLKYNPEHPENLKIFVGEKNRGLHGPIHWQQVYRNAMSVAKITKANRKVCGYFAYIHDSQRINDDEDPEHGERAATWVQTHKKTLPLTKKEINTLIIACRDHEKGFVSEDPTIGTCWDADRLDLTRVGVLPDPKLLSTEAAKTLKYQV